MHYPVEGFHTHSIGATLRLRGIRPVEFSDNTKVVQPEGGSLTFQALTVSNGKTFMERCLSRLPSGKGVPPFLRQDSSDSVAFLAEAALIDLPPMNAYDCVSGEMRATKAQRNQVAPQYVLGMHNGILLNAVGHVCTSDGQILIESMRDESLFDNRQYSVSDLRNKEYLASLSIAAARAKVRPGRWLSLVYALSSNWYHWLVENMGRVPAARAIPDFASLKIIVPPNLTNNQREALYAVGIQAKQVVEHDGEPWVCEELYLPSFGVVRASFHPATTLALKSSLDQALALPRGGRRRLLLSRADASIRRVINQEALSAALEQIGFEALLLGGLSLREQASAFAEAEAIVAPHGAGLANLIFARRGVPVIELLPAAPDRMLTLYHAFASALGMPYLGMMCPATGVDDDFMVPPDDVVKLVNGFARR